MQTAHQLEQPIGDPRGLEQEARSLESKDKERSHHLYELAARGWAERNGAYAASRHLLCARKAGFELLELLETGRRLAAEYPGDTHVGEGHAWICYDLAMQAARDKNPENTAVYVREALPQLSRARNPQLLAERLLAALRRVADKEESAAPQSPERLAPIFHLIAEKGASLEAALSCEPSRGSHQAESPSERLPSPRLLYYYLVRRLASSDLALVRVVDTLERAAAAEPRNEWFQSSHLRALLATGKTEAAAALGEEIGQRLPDSWAVAEARAAIEQERGDLAKAIAVLETACLAARSPWPWQELAGYREKQGDKKQAALDLACGLAHQDPQDPGKVWRLHRNRARLLLDLGEFEQAAEEASLAMEARRKGGWDDAIVVRWWPGPMELLQSTLVAHQAKQGDSARRKAMGRYRVLLERQRCAKCVAVRVLRPHDGKAIAFVETRDGRTAIALKKTLRTELPPPGMTFRALIVPSWDAKKERPGWRVAWIDRGSLETPRPGAGHDPKRDL